MENHSSFSKNDSSTERAVVTVVSEIIMTCAVVLLFFAYLKLEIPTATVAALFCLFAGSVFCWRGFAYAQIMLVLSLAVSEFVLLSFFDWLIAPFFILDVLAVISLSRIRSAHDEEASAQPA